MKHELTKIYRGLCDGGWIVFVLVSYYQKKVVLESKKLANSIITFRLLF
jgi:hypothetical protein